MFLVLVFVKHASGEHMNAICLWVVLRSASTCAVLQGISLLLNQILNTQINSYTAIKCLFVYLLLHHAMLISYQLHTTLCYAYKSMSFYLLIFILYSLLDLKQSINQSIFILASDLLSLFFSSTFLPIHIIFVVVMCVAAEAVVCAAHAAIWHWYRLLCIYIDF